jgi:hypothetical protein
MSTTELPEVVPEVAPEIEFKNETRRVSMSPHFYITKNLVDSTISWDIWRDVFLASFMLFVTGFFNSIID